ncbi:MAG: hypothetical protein ACK4QW_10600 [Alphaproteobacteria bacterium]
MGGDQALGRLPVAAGRAERQRRLFLTIQRAIWGAIWGAIRGAIRRAVLLAIPLTIALAIR